MLPFVTAIVPTVAAEARAHRVVCASDFGPYGRRRDEAVAAALTTDGRHLERIGSPYAVAPGTVVKGDGQPYRVFTAFYRQWQSQLDPETAPPPRASWKTLPSDGVPKDPSITAQLPEASEAAARSRLERFLEEGITDYRLRRERPADEGTSRLSPYLKFGLLHPDAVLTRLAAADEPFRRQLAWRDFYADVLWHAPESARRSWSPRMRQLRADHGPRADERFGAWAEGRTGYPLVDAGMRQLLAVGWMHNRVRMVTASFLVKDLHLPWERGARHFLAHLVDGDLASNNHGWQWVAGTGTDAAPFTRIFNPVAQSRRWDPDGAYLRRYLPELAGVSAPGVHEPWRMAGFPAPVVDHAEERLDALDRHREASARSRRRAR